MPITVEQVLKSSGLNDDQIKALDAKVLEGLGSVAAQINATETAALAAKDEAERTSRAQKEMYDNQIAPALDNWATEKANLEATAAFYRTQNEQARSGGFVPKDAPGYKAGSDPDPNAARDGGGRFVAGGNTVPGSPQFMTMEQGLTALTNSSWVQNEHFRLFGQPVPDELGDLLKQAAADHQDFRTFAAKKYGFDQKRTEIAAGKQKEHDDAIRKETAAAKDKEWAEKVGSNPNVRVGGSSQFSEVAKAVASGQRTDPLKQTREERHRSTQTAIQGEIVQNMVQ